MSSKLTSIFGFKCPTCHQGDLFPTSSFSFSMPFKQYSHCSECGQSFFPEPGFYYGAMFISYIGSGFFCLGFVMLLHWVFGWSTGLSFFALLVVVGICFVWWFRFSRAAYINILYGYKPDIADQAQRNAINVPEPTIVAGT